MADYVTDPLPRSRKHYHILDGLLLQRLFRPVNIRGAFWWCSLIVVCVTAMPHVCIGGHSVFNGIYEALSVVLVFPAVVWLGASGATTDRRTTAVCNFWGDVSYPLYAVHYPLMYLLYAWVWSNGITFSQGWPVALVVMLSSVALAYLALRIYDAPVRRWLSARVLKRKTN